MFLAHLWLVPMLYHVMQPGLVAFLALLLFLYPQFVWSEFNLHLLSYYVVGVCAGFTGQTRCSTSPKPFSSMSSLEVRTHRLLVGPLPVVTCPPKRQEVDVPPTWYFEPVAQQALLSSCSMLSCYNDPTHLVSMY